MENTGIRQQVIDEICALAEKYHARKVILFGSRARGDYKRASDIDLEVEGGDFEIIAQAKENFYEMFCELKKEVEANWL